MSKKLEDNLSNVLNWDREKICSYCLQRLLASPNICLDNNHNGTFVAVDFGSRSPSIQSYRYRMNLFALDYSLLTLMMMSMMKNQLAKCFENFSIDALDNDKHYASNVSILIDFVSSGEEYFAAENNYRYSIDLDRFSYRIHKDLDQFESLKCWSSFFDHSVCH